MLSGGVIWCGVGRGSAKKVVVKIVYEIVLDVRISTPAEDRHSWRTEIGGGQPPVEDSRIK